MPAGPGPGSPCMRSQQAHGEPRCWHATSRPGPCPSPAWQLVIKTCHRRGVHAIGGMSALIPVKGDARANEASPPRRHAGPHVQPPPCPASPMPPQAALPGNGRTAGMPPCRPRDACPSGPVPLQVAFDKVRTDKLREVQDGHDGTWWVRWGGASVWWAKGGVGSTRLGGVTQSLRAWRSTFSSCCGCVHALQTARPPPFRLRSLQGGAPGSDPGGQGGEPH